MADDRIDTRDLVERLAELDAIDPSDWDSDERDEHMSITALFEEISGYAGDSPEDGVYLISENQFEDYARELAENIGAVDRDAGWPMRCIDWERAADELAMDYTTVDYDGMTYYYR